MYRIDSFATVDEIVETILKEKTQFEAELNLGMSFALATREGDSKSMLRLALAHYVWKNHQLDADTMAEMVAVMNWQGVKKSKAQ
ncbi:MAG: hypothetical protein M9945_14465 [Aquamicrobium sp.]|uniref:hypothetical protein n=1 Tax=Aquamicrobium sp. TaxID=1872579 RepID=UPI00349EDDD5|nr:hypothetical protein [Aquamicrobium sp.]